MKNILALTLITLAGVAGVFAQSAEVEPSRERLEVLNTKAVSLPRPAYPPEARQAGAEGTVLVQVTIDAEGNVVDARAVSGPQLLRDAAQEAASKAKFPGNGLSGQPATVKGILIYNFLAEGSSTDLSKIKAEGTTRFVDAGNWFNVGLIMVMVELTPTLQMFDPDMVSSMLPREWVEERKQIERLRELKQYEIENGHPKRPIERRIAPDTTKVTIAPERTASTEAGVIAQILISSISQRLTGKPLDAWYFCLGVEMNRALEKADSRDKTARMSTVLPFRSFIDNAPADVPKEMIDELNLMYAMMEKGVLKDEDSIAFSRSMTKVTSMVGFRR